MKIKNFLLVLIIALFLIALPARIQETEPEEFVENMTFTTYSDLFFDYEITRYPTGVEITPSKFLEKESVIGVVIDPWNLKFGIVPTGGSFVRRYVELTNVMERAGKVSFKVYGNIKPLVSFSKNDFILHENENSTVTVFLSATNVTGNFSGEIDVIAQKPKYDFLYKILGWD